MLHELSGQGNHKGLSQVEFEYYKLLTQSELHFNGLLAEYRTQASRVLIGLFAITSALLSTKHLLPDYSAYLGITCTSVFAMAAMLLYWSLDLLVYQRLMDAVCSEKFKLEENSNDLIKLNHKMLLALGPKGPVPFVVLYYAAGVLMCATVGGTSFAFWADKFSTALIVTIGVTSWSIITFSLIWFIWHKSIGTASLLSRLKS